MFILSIGCHIILLIVIFYVFNISVVHGRHSLAHLFVFFANDEKILKYSVVSSIALLSDMLFRIAESSSENTLVVNVLKKSYIIHMAIELGLVTDLKI